MRLALPTIGSTMGNIFCRLPGGGTKGTPIFLCAHLDTVPPAGPIEPVVEDGVVRNAAGTILGADDKSAVAVMLAAARRIVVENRPGGQGVSALNAVRQTEADGHTLFFNTIGFSVIVPAVAPRFGQPFGRRPPVDRREAGVEGGWRTIFLALAEPGDFVLQDALAGHDRFQRPPPGAIAARSSLPSVL